MNVLPKITHKGQDDLTGYRQRGAGFVWQFWDAFIYTFLHFSTSDVFLVFYHVSNARKLFDRKCCDLKLPHVECLLAYCQFLDKKHMCLIFQPIPSVKLDSGAILETSRQDGFRVEKIILAGSLIPQQNHPYSLMRWTPNSAIYINGHFRNLSWRYLSYIRSI